ncbi:SRPBCC family protein, partial [Nocardioides pacificus]
MEFTVELVAQASTERAHAYFADPALRPRWQSSLRAVEPLDGPAQGVGARWYDVTSVGARPLMEVTEDVPGRVWSEVGEWHGLVARLRMTFSPVGADAAGPTLVRAVVSVEAPGWRRPLGWAIRVLGPVGIR